jgi:hypothetical protein
MNYVYHLIVAYLTAQLVWYIVREKAFWKQAGAGLVLVLFILRLLLIQ